MRVYLQTDLEGVAGVRNFQEWADPTSRNYDLGCRLLTAEVNAAIDGLFAGGASYILVADSHGAGAIDILDVDPRAELMRWDWRQPWPQRMQEGFDYLVFVGQHAKSRTRLSNMTHTGNCEALECSINGTAVGEFGQVVACASELGIRTIFASGEQALADEATALLPGIETVAVKRGLREESGDACSHEEYEDFTPGAVHVHPETARKRIREGAERAIVRARDETFGSWDLRPPYRVVTVFRHSVERPQRTYVVKEDAVSVIAALNQDRERETITSREQLDSLLTTPLDA